MVGTTPTRRSGGGHRALAAPSTSAVLAWPERYAQLFAAHTRLQETLAASEAAHRKALTVVKYEPSLPNNDVYTKELLAQNRALQQQCRALELRLAKLDTVRTSAPSSLGRAPRTKALDSRGASHRSLQHMGVQTEETQIGEHEESKNVPSAAAEKPRDGDTKMICSAIPEQIQTLIETLKQRLEDLDLDVSRLQRENELLRTEREQDQNGGEQSNASLRAHKEQQELEQMFQDRVRQMNILEQQFQHLQAKAKTTSRLYKQSLEKIEELTTELFDAKQTLLKQAEWLHAHEDTDAQRQVLETEVHVLRNENTTLNETVSVLSARPLEAFNLEIEKKALQVSVLEEKNAALEDQLQRARQDHGIVTHTNDKLRQRIDVLTKQLDGPLQEIQKLQAEVERLGGERETAELQLKFYLSGETIESKELMDAVGRALKQMRAEKEGTLTAKDCENVTKEQTLAKGSTLEHERVEQMAHITKLIQEDTHAQLQEMKLVHEAQVRDLKRQCTRWQQRADEYLREITALRQAKERVVSAQAGNQGERPWKSTRDSIFTETMRTVPLDAKENLLEVRLCDLRSSVGGREQGTSSFVLFCDFYDFESQHSPVFAIDRENPTSVAPVELEVSYKLLVDQAFCRSPIAQTLSIELHHLQVATASIVGSANVSLQPVFLSECGYMAMSVKLLDPTTSAAIGSIRVAVSLARPVQHLFRAWNTRDVVRIRPMPRLEQSGSSVHLEIRCIALVLSTAASNGPVKVRYRFMGNPFVHYKSQNVPKTSGGFSVFAIDRARGFEIPSDDAFIAFLEKHELTATVEIPGGTQGQADVPFQAVVNGFRANKSGSTTASSLITSVDHPNQPGGQLGRVWLELRLFDVKAMEAIRSAVLWDPVFRVFGDSDGSHIHWHCFCAVMELSSAERAVRQMLFDKLQAASAEPKTLRKLLEEASTVDIVSICEQAGLRFSRSELSFVSAALSPNDIDKLCGDETQPIRPVDVEHIQRLTLLAKTMHDDWLEMEPHLRMHVETLGVLAKYAEGENESIRWDTFLYRIRLTT